MLTSTITICLMLLSIVGITYNVALLRKSKRMRAREEALKKNGVTPYGSGLCHGMVLGSDGKTVKHDSKKSNSWYARLV